MESKKQYKVISDLKNPSRNGQIFDIVFPYNPAQHIYKYFKHVSDWADGAIIEEVE
jgi:hypothetical protein